MCAVCESLSHSIQNRFVAEIHNAIQWIIAVCDSCHNKIRNTNHFRHHRQFTLVIDYYFIKLKTINTENTFGEFLGRNTTVIYEFQSNEYFVSFSADFYSFRFASIWFDKENISYNFHKLHTHTKKSLVVCTEPVCLLASS